MAGDTADPLELFRLRPTRAAKVSEISEATASSSLPPEERVNFHIGNPVQEPRLTAAYLRAILGLDVRDGALGDDDESLLRALDLPPSDLPAVGLLRTLVHRSAPYLPRGGFPRSAPSPLAVAALERLEKQQEPLAYDLGKASGRRELIFSSGGIVETLRVFFHALSGYLVHLPAHVLLHRLPLPPHATAFRGIETAALPDDEASALDAVGEALRAHPGAPTFLVLGALTSEETRRALRSLSLDAPLFFLEVNDAPNHLSLAREARLIDRVIRFLTPALFAPRLAPLSIVIVAGNADYLSLLETVHFQLKGTPSASEAELLTFLIGRTSSTPAGQVLPVFLPADPPTEAPGFGLSGEHTIVRRGIHAEERLQELLEVADAAVGRAAALLDAHGARIARRTAGSRLLAPVDRFAGTGAVDLVREIEHAPDSADLADDLRSSFLAAFIRHHPWYDQAHCTAVSGSARTALSLLGFHCGIREVVVPDLSWTYEHCFPASEAVALTPEFGLDVDALIAAVERKIAGDPGWPEYGAVVLNNPHNATGRIFDPAAVQRLLQWLLERGVTVIDDLSYENVAPVDALPDIPTVRRLAEELVALGRLRRDQVARVITVHSISKTDCLAGARLAVVEIRRADLLRRFRNVQASIATNLAAILLGYLFYRRSLEVARAFWRLRNALFLERMRALEEALANLPPDRNPYGIEIVAPTGSMYPLLFIHRLPPGLSLDWVASGLARQGIGMVPLSTFARTEEGYQAGRSCFRLTLGGTDGAAILLKKTRRVLIDLNRLISEEESNYRRRRFPVRAPLIAPPEIMAAWDTVAETVRDVLHQELRSGRRHALEELREERSVALLMRRFLPEQLEIHRRRCADRIGLARALVETARADNGKKLAGVLQREFYRDALAKRQETFRERLFDRTVHPTQMHALRTEAAFDRVADALLRGLAPTRDQVAGAARELLREFLCLNVAITSAEEADEVLLDLDAHLAAELAAEYEGAALPPMFLSFWGDWDGSNRPSGQGHQLVAAVLLENVRRLARLLRLVADREPGAKVPADLLAEIGRLPRMTAGFTRLLSDITSLTHQLERRYRGILPFHATPGPLRRIGMTLHVAADPVTSLWHHNDRTERRMRELRRKRREALEYYFALNKRLRKELFRLVPDLLRHLNDPHVAREAVLYRDLLQRFLLTPRIHQRMITMQDPFAIDTTVFNIHEINEVAARYGNPGMVLALQVSMSTRPDALVALDRKMRSRREHVLRDHPGLDLPSVWLVPLFEGPEAVRDLLPYLNKIWEHALQSRRMNQETSDRFAELVSEVFIAGSDLSQQVGQAAGAQLNRQAKLEMMRWLAERGLAGRVRLKVGSGEPMQRQGGYYNARSGERAFLASPDADRRFALHLRESARTSTAYATTPMMGMFSGGDLRTLQSAVAEQVRRLPVLDFAQFLFHLRGAQQSHHRDLVRACEELAESRLRSTRRGEAALERLTVGTREDAYETFLTHLTANFRQILYGREEDVVGIHIISYFIARTTPPLRDRPTVRPGGSGKGQGNRILERIAETIPLSRYGSLLRAIAHNQAQTVVLGINQLTTGLFRALDAFARSGAVEGDPQSFIADRILPRLPVYEILQTLRQYHDRTLAHLGAMERAIPAGNSAFLALREDVDAMAGYIPLLQQELLRRHGIDIADFFEGSGFIPDLLPTLRPDLAVLLQRDLFNTDLDRLLVQVQGAVDPDWRAAVSTLLDLPRDIGAWRARAWSLLERPVLQRVESFVELAIALSSLSPREGGADAVPVSRELRLPTSLANFFKVSPADDEMRQFLAAAVDYLRSASSGMIEVPATIVRAMKDVERIAKIEEQALSTEGQEKLRFYLLQIARLTGENG